MKKLTDSDLQLINKFMNEDLSREETISFNERMKHADFADEVEFQKSVAQSITEVRTNLLRDEFRKQLRETKPDQRTSGSAFRYWAAAAALLVIVVAGLYFFFPAHENENLFAAYYKPYPAPVVTRGSAPGPSQELEQSLQEYRVGNYAACARSLEAILETGTESNQEEVRLLLGNCYLQLNDLPQAKQIFTEVSFSGNAEFAQHATWYNALTLLKSNQTEQALLILNTIRHSSSIYRQQASSLAENLNAKN